MTPRRRRLLTAVGVVLLLVAAGAFAFVEYQGSRRALHARAGRLAGAAVTPLGADETSTYSDVALRSTSGLEVKARVRVPRAGTPPYPAVLLMGGINLGRRVVRVSGLEEIARFAVVVSLDYPMTRRRELMAMALRVRSVGLDTIADILLGLDYLESRADVDRRRLFLIGSSLGAPAVTIAGAIDERPAAVISLYGGGRLGALVAHTLQHADQQRPYPRWQALALGHGLAWLLIPLEPTRYVGAIAPRPFLMVAGADDTLVPREYVDALYEAARPPKEILWIRGEHVQADEASLIREVAGRLTAWLVQRGLLPAGARTD